ncbi:GNAT family N-acetyltransferase [Cohnella pontilimi]|nr:GNAT family N-acetyltransferase [Cohnella pontilimi]
MAEIRNLTIEDFDDRVALSEFAFQYAVSPEDKEQQRKNFRPEDVYGLFGDDGRMLSSLFILPFEIWLRGRKLAMGGVAGVASWPDSRRQGSIARLLTHSFEEMRRKGQSISALYPFSYAFYRKYGYEMMTQKKQYTIEPRWFPPRRDTAGTVKLVEKSMELLDPVYQTFAARYDGMLVRDRYWWDSRALKAQMAAVYSNPSGQAEGYMLYQVKDKHMKVFEWVALTEEARIGLWSYAGNHDSMADQLTMTVPADDPLPFLLPEPRLKQEVTGHFMSRIVDAQAFVGQYRFEESDRTDELLLHLEDGHAPWNEGLFQLRIEPSGKAALERVTRAAGDGGTSAVSLDIQTLTVMLAGNLRPRMLQRTGRLQGAPESAALLERRVPLVQPYLFDFF